MARHFVPLSRLVNHSKIKVLEIKRPSGQSARRVGAHKAGRCKKEKSSLRKVRLRIQGRKKAVVLLGCHEKE